MTSNRSYTESDVQSLKAQEAKDYCIELMQQLAARDGGPISPGEVQLQELQFELELKEAEAADNRQRESHFERIKSLELEQLQQQASEHRSLADQEIQSIRELAINDFKRQFNVNASEPMDVTDLFYRERVLPRGACD